MRRTIHRFAFVGFTALALTGLAGCSKANKTIPLATESRVLQAGDNWTHDVERVVRFNENGQSVKLTGELTETVIQTTFNGEPSLAWSAAENLTAPNGYKDVRTWQAYFRQDSTTRDVMHLGDTHGKDGALRVAKTPALDAPGTWSAKTAYSSDTEFSNGDRHQATHTVVGTEEVETPAGKFTCWKLNVHGRNTQGDKTATFQGTLWVAPHVGVVKSHVVVTVGTEMSITTSRTLRSTSVPLE